MKLHTFVATLLVSAGTMSAVIAQKPAITAADQLPRRTYHVNGTVVELLADKPQLDRLASELMTNLTGDLQKYEITDKATLIGYYSTLLTLHWRKGSFDEAQTLIQKIRALETKPAARLTSGLFAEIAMKTSRQAGDEKSDGFSKAFEENYLKAVSGMPYGEIKEYVDTTRAQASIMTADLVRGSIQSGLQPLFDKTGGVVPEGAVSSLLSAEMVLERRLPLNDEIGRALSRLNDTSNTAVKNIWAGREAMLPPDGLHPVTIAIWDSGVDMTSIPEEHRFVNPRERIDGKDNDGNGFVDDVHGIAFDMVAMTKKTSTLDDRAAAIKSDLRHLHTLTKGSIDATSGNQSAEATEFTRVFGSLKGDEVKALMDDLNFYTAYAHGTHVAGISIAGNPAARVLAARMTTPFRQPVPARTLQSSKFYASMFRDAVDYFKKHGVRIVNMSWRYTVATIEASLTANNIGKDAQERKVMARKLFDLEKTALFEAIKNAPGILFVCGSGNEDNDADFEEYIPASFNLPNIVTVGAVDISGRKTSFTTEGKSVDFYAGGHLIESYAPNGQRLTMSGTSMASPQVANLAAKILALAPDLEPTAIVTLIEQGSEPSSEDPHIKLINPKRTIALVERARR